MKVNVDTDMLRRYADARAEYSAPECQLQAATLRQMASILEGDVYAALGFLPSWRWDDFGVSIPDSEPE